MFDWLFGNVKKLVAQVEAMKLDFVKIQAFVTTLVTIILALQKEAEVLRAALLAAGVVLPVTGSSGSVVTEEQKAQLQKWLDEHPNVS